jgi:hypothetical protein
MSGNANIAGNAENARTAGNEMDAPNADLSDVASAKSERQTPNVA